jgi:hypothetical protein
MVDNVKEWKKLFFFLQEANEHNVEVGFFENSKYPSLGDTKGKDVLVGDVARANEFGSSKQGRPPRPFMRNAQLANSAKWAKVLEKKLKVATTRKNYQNSMLFVGSVIEADIKQSIEDFQKPSLAESTIKAKGFPKPLISTAIMLNSVTHQYVKSKKGSKNDKK